MPRRDDYTAGWVCALHVELAVAQETLDEEHCDLERDSADNDQNLYIRVGLNQRPRWRRRYERRSRRSGLSRWSGADMRQVYGSVDKHEIREWRDRNCGALHTARVRSLPPDWDVEGNPGLGRAMVVR